jgi:hypothetical protein
VYAGAIASSPTTNNPHPTPLNRTPTPPEEYLGLNDRICYLQRTDRGLALAGIRLIRHSADDRWDATVGGSTDAVLETIEDGAVWIRQRLKSGSGSSKSLPLLCLDTDGAVCTWTKPEDTNPEMIAAAVDQLDAGHDDEGLEGGYQSTMGERFPNLPLEVHYESLADDQTSEGSRRAVIATPDVPARLLIDHLDSMGIRIGRVESIWSLIARAWDPGAAHRSSARDSQRVVSTDDPVCGSVILDPSRSRLIWTWSKQGQLIAAGSMRVGHGAQGLAITSSDLSRLCSDWLGWASQLGVAPMRVVLVIPEIEDGLDRNQIGSVFAKHWPTATLDLVTESDPILATLRAVQGFRCKHSVIHGLWRSAHKSPRPVAPIDVPLGGRCSCARRHRHRVDRVDTLEPGL